MKILLAITSHLDLDNPRSGGLRCLQGRAQALSKRGHEVVVVNLEKDAPDIQDYDIVQLENGGGGNGPLQAVAKWADDTETPVLGVPVYWPNKRLPHLKKQHERLFVWLNYCDLVIPGSEIVANKLEETEDMPDFNYQIVRKAVSQREIKQVRKEFTDPPLNNYVLTAGWIGPQKNQLRIAKALKRLWEDGFESDWLLVGKIHKQEYFDKITETLSSYEDRVHFVQGFRPPGHVMGFAKYAKAVIVGSLWEIPSLVALEAAALETSIAITKNGSTKEYYRDYVEYFDPESINSIKLSVKKAAKGLSKKEELKELVLSKYSYAKAASDLEEIYQEVL